MRRRKRFTIVRIALALTAAAIVPVAAHAEPTPAAGSDVRAQYQLGPGEIPYLSQGVGVDSAHFGQTLGADDRALPRTTISPSQKLVEIPYLSQGKGVTSEELGFAVSKSPDDRPFARSTPVDTSAPVVTDGGSSIDVSPYTVTGFGLALLLVMFGMGLAIRHNRKGTLSPA